MLWTRAGGWLPPAAANHLAAVKHDDRPMSRAVLTCADPDTSKRSRLGRVAALAARTAVRSTSIRVSLLTRLLAEYNRRDYNVVT